MRRSALTAVAGALALAALTALTTYVFLRPNVLRVAVVAGSEDHAVMTVAAQTMARERTAVRLRLQLVDSGVKAAAMLESGDVDLAVVRTDIAVPKSGQTAVILHRNAAVIVAPPGSKLEKITDLRGRTVAIMRAIANNQPVSANERLLDTILRQYDVTPDSVSRISITPGDLVDVVASKRADAVFTTGVLTSGILPEVVAVMARVGEGAPVFIPVTEADAIAQRLIAFESMEIVKGVFGGAPPKPARSFETLSFTTRLFARSTLKDSVVSDLTRFFFTKRAVLAEQAPLAERIEAPSTDKGAALAVHPGAAAYLDGEEETFFDKYSDFFYIGAMLLSIVGSGLAALASRMGSAQSSPLAGFSARLLQILKEARLAPDAAALDGYEAEIDQVLSAALGDGAASVEPNRLGVLALAVDQARLAVAERRRALTA